jgi:glyoxalase family protein
MSIQGLHHITLVCAEAQRTVDFYTKALGLRLVKKTVNFDDPGSYHLYFGDEVGRPGTAVTFFEWPDAPKGAPGIGGTHHFALTAPDEKALLKWKRRLTDLGIRVNGPLDRNYFKSIYFHDPDGELLEIATMGPGWAVDEKPECLGSEYREPPEEMKISNRDKARIEAATWPEPVPEITGDMALKQGMHHISAISSDVERTHAFWGELLGLRRVKMTSDFDQPNVLHWYWGVGEGKPGTVLTYFQYDPKTMGRMRMGAGQTHHFALAVSNEETQLAWREKLVRAMLPVSPVMDRIYFKSIYTRDPDGHIVELATMGPGFPVDELVAELGQSLKLPPWLEQNRREIERALKPIAVSSGMY